MGACCTANQDYRNRNLQQICLVEGVNAKAPTPGGLSSSPLSVDVTPRVLSRSRVGWTSAFDESPVAGFHGLGSPDLAERCGSRGSACSNHSSDNEAAAPSAPLGVLGSIKASRTVRLLLLPLGTCALTAGMTILNTVWTLDVHPRPLFFSDSLNSPVPEPWILWGLRWLLWHIVAVSVASFKCRILPRQMHWVCILAVVLTCLVIWSGWRQTTPSYNVYNNMYKTHQLAALGFLVAVWLETVTLWWPTKLVNVVYGAIVAFVVISYECILGGQLSFATGIPYLYDHPEIPFEWLAVILHFPIVWHRYPHVQRAVEDGTWQPWCCCVQPCGPENSKLAPEQFSVFYHDGELVRPM